MSFPGIEFGGSGGAIYQDTVIDGGTYAAPAGMVIFAVVPSPSATVKAIASQGPSMTLNRKSDGGAIPNKTSPFYGNYVSVTVSSGAVDIYIRSVGA